MINSLRLVISCVYRPHAANIDAFNEVLFNHILPGMSFVTKKSIVCGCSCVCETPIKLVDYRGCS